MFTKIANIFISLFTLLRVIVAGLVSLLYLIVMGAVSLVSGGIGPFLLKPATQQKVFNVLRAFWPNIALNTVIIKSYENTGTVIVTRREDVLDVLSRDADFEVVYGSRMKKLTNGDNFFLGMQPGWDYQRDVSAMRLAARIDDVPNIILPNAQTRSAEIVESAGGKIDMVQDLTLLVPWEMTSTYFGAGGERDAMAEWTTNLFWYLFADLGADEQLDDIAMSDAAALRSYLDDHIAARKAKPTKDDDVLNRCLALQKADTPGMSDLGIRNNLLGLLIGAIPTISKASCFAIYELLNRPEQLAGAQAAARDGNDALMANYVWEALRFNPFSPLLYRRATRDATIAPSTLRRVRVKKGQMVFATTAAACFDPYDLASPGAFKTDRPWETYIPWGYGMHKCFGSAINKAVIPAILKPVLMQKNLRRAPGVAGQINNGTSAFPQHFHLEWDR